MGNNPSNIGSGQSLRTDSCSPSSKINGLATQSYRFRACGIDVTNSADPTLHNPRKYNSTGMLQAMPPEILSGSSGFILAESSWGLLEGSCGVFSYDIGDDEKKLQICWFVPLDLNLKSCAVSVRIGTSDEKMRDLFWKMYNAKKDYGYWCDADEQTSHVFVLNDRFEAYVLMGNSSRTTLHVEFRNRGVGCGGKGKGGKEDKNCNVISVAG